MPNELVKIGTPLLSPNATKDIKINLKVEKQQSTVNSESSSK